MIEYTDDKIKEIIKGFIDETLNTQKQPQSYKERRLKEHKELKERIIKLIDFLYSPETGKLLDETEVSLMCKQLDAMLIYLAQLTNIIIYSENKSGKTKKQLFKSKGNYLMKTDTIIPG